MWEGTMKITENSYRLVVRKPLDREGRMFQHIWEKEQLLDSWKTGLIILLPKKGNHTLYLVTAENGEVPDYFLSLARFFGYMYYPAQQDFWGCE